MKRIGLQYLLPAAIAVTVLFLSVKTINGYCFTLPESAEVNPNLRYLENFSTNRQYEPLFLAANDTSETIYLMGSSELTRTSSAAPYNFIPDRFQTKVVGIGHAGNQCFSIYSQLLANQDKLENAPIVILLSPGWFHTHFSGGTASSSFLEYNTPTFLNQVLANAPQDEFRAYEAKRIADFYTEIVNPDLSLKLLNYEYQSSKSFIHKGCYYPLIALDKWLNQQKAQMTGKPLDRVHRRKMIAPEDVRVAWDSLFHTAKAEQRKRSASNELWIEDAFYAETNGKLGEVFPVSDANNTELEDFKMLVKLLKARKANVSFVIMPLNPGYYENCSELTPVMKQLEQELKTNGLPYLNMWNDNPKTFDNGILSDVMHYSDYGWYRVNQFIVNTYHLSK
ncbi:MAG TPA: D-alanyl-lipoteichoic acid biosynthesis protein DltD [Fluviicola sp.]|nr:D-alanyl-lipoteichoic acid biosynthesis protein DltD [Fluviicola sp.]